MKPISVIEFDNSFQLDLDIIWGVGDRKKEKEGERTFYNIFHTGGMFTIFDQPVEDKDDLVMQREVFIAFFNAYKDEILDKVFIKYNHHGCDVWVNNLLKGTHRDHCLCYDCKNWKDGTPEKCVIATELYEMCIKHNLVTPVFECPHFE